MADVVPVVAYSPFKEIQRLQGTDALLTEGGIKSTSGAIAVDGFSGIDFKIGSIAKVSIDSSARIIPVSGGGLFTRTIDGHTAVLAAYDVDGATYSTFATLTAGNSPSFVIGGNSSWNGNVVGVTYGGTGTATQFDMGSVVFAGASGVYTQDITADNQFFYDATNHRLGLGNVSPDATLDIHQAAVVAGVSAIHVRAGAHTAQTASIELEQFHFAQGGTVTWATGALGTQRFFRVRQPTMAFVGPSTASTVATMTIEGAPEAGANATLTDVAILSVGGSVTQAASPTHIYYGLKLSDHTVNYSTTTGITSAGPRMAYVGTLTLTNASTHTIDNASGLIVKSPTVTGSARVTSTYGTQVGSSCTVATATTAIYRPFEVPAHTVTLTGATAMTTSGAMVAINSVTHSGSGFAISRFAGLLVASPLVTGGVTVAIVDVVRVIMGGTYPSLTSFAYSGLRVQDSTVTMTGTTTNLAVNGVSSLTVGQMTVSNAAVQTTNYSSGLFITSVPTVAGSAIITEVAGIRVGDPGGTYTVTHVSTAGFIYSGVEIRDATVNMTGTVSVTSRGPSQGFFGQLTVANTATQAFSYASGIIVESPTVTGSARVTEGYGIQVGRSCSLGAAIGASVYNVISIPVHTLTLTGTNTITAANGVAGMVIGQLTVTNASVQRTTTLRGLFVYSPTLAGSAVATNYRGIATGTAFTMSATTAATTYYGLQSGSQTITMTGTTGMTSVPSMVSVYGGQITITGSAVTIDSTAAGFFSPATVSGSPVVTRAVGVHVNGDMSHASATGFSYKGVFVDAQTLTLTGVAAVAGIGASGIHVSPLTITVGTASMTNAASIYVAGPPTGATNNFSLWIDAGDARIDGYGSFGGTHNTDTVLTMTQTAATTGTASILTITGAANTGQTAATDDVDFNIARTVTWSVTPITQRFIRIRQPTIAFTTSGVVNNASTLNIEGAPAMAASVTSAGMIHALLVSGTTTLPSTATMLYATALFGATLTLTGTTTIPDTGLSPGVAGVRVGGLTITDASAVTVTSAAGLTVGSPTVGGSVTITNPTALLVGTDNTLASVAGLTYSGIRVLAHTATLTGTTTLTGDSAIAVCRLGQITVADASSITVTGATTLSVAIPTRAGATVTMLDVSGTRIGGSSTHNSHASFLYAAEVLTSHTLTINEVAASIDGAGLSQLSIGTLTVTAATVVGSSLGQTINVTSLPTQAGSFFFIDVAGIRIGTAGTTHSIATQFNYTPWRSNAHTLTLIDIGGGNLITTGTVAAWAYIEQLTVTSAVASTTLTSLYGARVASPAVSGTVSATNVIVMAVGSNTTHASATTFAYSLYRVPAHTLTLTGVAAVTTSPGAAGVYIGQVTVVPGTASMSTAASLYIDNATTGATTNYAIWVAAGNSRFAGDVTITGKLTVGGAIDPTMVLLSGADKRFGATDAGAVYLAPFTDAVAGVQVRKADNTTVVTAVDTLNGRFGVGTATPSDTLHIVGSSLLAGNLRHTGTNLGFFSAAVVAQQTVGANVNNVVASGTTGQFDDFTDGTVYTNDYANLHATISQLCRSMKQLTDSVRNLGLAV
jgi:hypothetical protein